jgi:hypothetical protein
VILVDANLLLYAYHPRAAQHEASRAWLEACSRGLISFALPGSRCGPRVFERPLSTPSRSCDFLLARPASRRDSRSGRRHWEILRGLVRDGQAAGPLVMDAVLAAIALEHGATVCATDRDFSRFSGLRWTNPLADNR